MTTALKLDKEGNLRLSEADVTKQVCDFMAAEGWRGVRMNVGAFRKLVSSECFHDSTGRWVKFGAPGLSLISQVVSPPIFHGRPRFQRCALYLTANGSPVARAKSLRRAQR